MSSDLLYSKIYDNYISCLKKGNIKIDENIKNFVDDMRLGISLIIPINSIYNYYKKLVNSFLEIDNSQYYYPLSDLHITIFDFVKGTQFYKRNFMLENELIRICDKVFQEINVFDIIFSGIVFSDEAGLIKGYDSDMLIKIRNKIRKIMLEFDIPLDERYKSESAHITFCRFNKKIDNLKDFLNLINYYSSYDIGEQKVEYIELVEHDWYNLINKKRIIKKYCLQK